MGNLRTMPLEWLFHLTSAKARETKRNPNEFQAHRNPFTLMNAIHEKRIKIMKQFNRRPTEMLEEGSPFIQQFMQIKATLSIAP